MKRIAENQSLVPWWDSGSLVLALVLTLVLALVLTLVLALVLTLVLGQDQEPSICVIGVSLLQQSAPHLEQGVTRGQEVS